MLFVSQLLLGRVCVEVCAAEICYQYMYGSEKKNQISLGRKNRMQPLKGTSTQNEDNPPIIQYFTFKVGLLGLGIKIPFKSMIKSYQQFFLTFMTLEGSSCAVFKADISKGTWDRTKGVEPNSLVLD